MTGEGDDGSNRNRTVFRPSPLQRLKKEGQQRPRLSDPEDAQWAPSGSDDGARCGCAGRRSQSACVEPADGRRRREAAAGTRDGAVAARRGRRSTPVDAAAGPQPDAFRGQSVAGAGRRHSLRASAAEHAAVPSRRHRRHRRVRPDDCAALSERDARSARNMRFARRSTTLLKTFRVRACMPPNGRDAALSSASSTRISAATASGSWSTTCCATRTTTAI